MSFQQQILSTSELPLTYEDSTLLDTALEILPLERLYNEAEKAETQNPSWGLQDHVIRELLRWFKHDFFTWVNAPSCSFCTSPTNGTGTAAASEEERKDGAGHVELYKCTNCGRTERFPRYERAGILLKTRRGRCGEWANCFTFLCRALGSRVRYIMNSEDHVWTEVYSEKQQRWIHADSCEEAWDNPTLYEKGWGKKMAYCIAFSTEGAMDVTARYVRDKSKALPRDKISEHDLQQLLTNITTLRLSGLDPLEQARVVEERDLERAELESFKTATTDAAVGPRQSGAGEWTRQRGEDGGH